MNGFVLRLKLLLTDKVAGIAYLLTALVMVGVLWGLNIHAAERSAIPIGLLQAESGDLADKLTKRILATESLYVYRAEETELIKLLKDGYIECYIVIPAGYSDGLKAGKPDGLLKLITPQDNRVSSLVCDIIAGAMMEEVCLNKAYRKYMSLDQPLLSFEEYADYYYQEALKEDYSFSFITDYIDIDRGRNYRQDISNAMLYRQVIAGMLAMLLTLMAFCSSYRLASDKEELIRSRRLLTRKGLIKGYLEEYPAIMVYLLPVIILASCFAFAEGGLDSFAKLLILNIIFTLVFALVYFIIANTIRNIFSYQLIGIISIILFGIMGFVYVFVGLMGAEVFSLSPDAIYIRLFALN